MGCSGGGETIPVGDPTHPVEDLLIGGAVLAWQKAALSEAQRDEARQDRESESALLLDVAIPALAQALADLDDITVTGRQAGKDRIGDALTRLHTGRLGMGRGARVMTMRETIATYRRFAELEHARAEAAGAVGRRLEEALRFYASEDTWRYVPTDAGAEHAANEDQGDVARAALAGVAAFCDEHNPVLPDPEPSEDETEFVEAMERVPNVEVLQQFLKDGRDNAWAGWDGDDSSGSFSFSTYDWQELATALDRVIIQALDNDAGWTCNT